MIDQMNFQHKKAYDDLLAKRESMISLGRITIIYHKFYFTFKFVFDDPYMSKIKSNKDKLIIKVKQNPKQWTNKSIDMMVTSSESTLIAPEVYLDFVWSNKLSED